MSEPTLRLKRAVRARSLAAEGVAVSMGATAVVLRGAPADAVWRALEPVLRSGFTPEALVERFPERGRAVLVGILDRLKEHGFLREVEEEHDLDESGQAAYPHLEPLTARPFAALRALAGSSVRVRSESARVEARVRRALGRAGFRDVAADTGAPLPGVLVGTRLTVPGHPEAVHVIVAERGVWVSGPRDATATPEVLDGLRAWAAALDEPPGIGPDAPESEVARTLVAAQLALALVAHVARVTEGTPQARDPEFMVTTDELVSEPHRLPLLPALDPEVTGAFPEVSAPAPLVTDRLDALAPLWDRVFGPVGEPLPGDLPQLPVGLARTARRGGSGCGVTTAEARLDALTGSLHAVAWGRKSALAGHGVGSTRAEAIGDAVGDLVLRETVPWKEVDPPEPMSARARRLWAALTLRSGVAATACFHELEDLGLWRVDVVGPDGSALAVGAAAEPDPALREALVRAVAVVREDPPGLAVRAARTPDAALSLAAWADASGRVRVAAPEGAAAWAAHGVHTAVAAWT
ncbi:hypothetical protein PWG71_16920 [Nocardiopsis sp. N85]|uniref:hypothetical protein n=1 Tax=Nocardiopsis sp. N85 TaxID=3029400 RepID=UPI00237F9ADB|nr:hypothetical protein [Nocardiopsis sp. N85]MDE3723075.1 hypothetical protein [Nocardiopsis sp. N85]